MAQRKKSRNTQPRVGDSTPIWGQVKCPALLEWQRGTLQRCHMRSGPLPLQLGSQGQQIRRAPRPKWSSDAQTPTPRSSGKSQWARSASRTYNDPVRGRETPTRHGAGKSSGLGGHAIARRHQTGIAAAVIQRHAPWLNRSACSASCTGHPRQIGRALRQGRDGSLDRPISESIRPWFAITPHPKIEAFSFSFVGFSFFSTGVK